MNSMIGKKQRVLIEKVNESGLAFGYGEHYLPVSFQTTDSTKNIFNQVVLKQVDTSQPLTVLGLTIKA